ncbi:MAG TPA: RNA polymerase sigma factor [Polyangiales bacterium]|nr:RNA polymerase sigma factor [Polyangiales bacterium]
MTTDAERASVEAAYKTHARRVLATLIRLLGSFDDAEEALHDAFAAAATQWPRDGMPANPYAWLVSAGRFKTIERWRRQARVVRALPDFSALADTVAEPEMQRHIQDDELRLIFICCHPALAPDARIALTLREVVGLTTEEIARAYLTSAPTIAQRIVRAKAKIRDEAIAYEVPEPAELSGRVESVLEVIYLISSEGYAATDGPDLTRSDLCAESIRLGRLLVELLHDSEAQALLALMLLHDARSATRTDAAGDLILLEDQDRALWNREQIAEAKGLIERALTVRRVGSYLYQAAIASLHAEAARFDQTDWVQIVGLYDGLLRVARSPVAALNRAVAVAMRDGPLAGLAAIDAVFADGGLDHYHLAHAARADMQRRLGQLDAARVSYERALAVARQPAERRFLQKRLAEIA